LSPTTGYKRLLSGRKLSLDEIRRFTAIDPECEYALIATITIDDEERQIGVVRYVKEACADEAEFAIVLADDWQGRGLGTEMLASLIAAAKRHGVRRLKGTTLAENREMIALARKLGFRATSAGAALETSLVLELTPAA